MTDGPQITTREGRLLVALDAGDVGAWEWNVVSGQVIWTETLERIHGFEPGSFGGTFDVYQSYIHEEDRDLVFASIERALAGEAPYEVEYRMHRPDGSMHWVSARGRVFRDEAGRPQTMSGICMDVTALRRASDALRLMANASAALASSLEVEHTLETVARLCVPHLGDWCVIDLLEEDGELRRVALAHRDPEKERVGRELGERYPTPPDAPAGPARVVREGVTEFVPDIPLDLLRASARDQEHYRILVSLGMRSYVCLPLRARERIVGALTIVNAESRRSHDADDLALAEELAARAALAIDNARLYHRSVEASRAKDEFLAMLSHELRTPLTAVLGYASLIERGALGPDDLRAAIEAIKSSARAQARIVDDILDASRQLLGKIRIEMAPIDLAPIVRSAVEDVAPMAQARGIAVHVHGTAECCFIHGDRNRLQQILWNLLSNAVKFSTAGGEVHVRLSTAGGEAMVEVADSGEGVDPAFLPYVFDRFRQGPSSREHGGLGLGLAIARHLVEMHAGTIEARSEGKGKGATFVVRLPVPRAGAPEVVPSPKRDAAVRDDAAG